MGISDPAKTTTSDSSALALTDASDQLIRYMRFVANNDIVSSIASGNTSEITSRIQEDPDTALYNRTIKDIVQQINTTDSPTADILKKTADQTTGEDSKTNATVHVIEPEDFGSINNPRSSSGENNQNKLSTSITHYAITNSGKEFNFSDRGSEYVAMFCNLIPSVELSLCVPHFKISFTQVESQQTSNFIPFLSLESFLGAGQENASSIGITAQKTIPSGHNSSPKNNTNERIGTRTSGMELFLAPQTLINSDINTTALYQNARNITVLDPMQPLMSIESIGIDVNAISRNFMVTNTTVNLTIILHDRSRLAEIAPLVSPSLRPTIRSEIEYGWNHPDDISFTNNPYAKFLNALKVKQIFSVTQATLSSRDATSLSIKVTLTSLGNSIANDLSAYTGEYIEYKQAEAKLKQVFRIIETSSDAGTKDAPQTTSQIHIGDDVIVSTSAYESSDKWIKYSDYVAITDIVNEGLQLDKINNLIDIYTRIISETNNQTDTNTNAIITSLRNNIKKDLTSMSWRDSAYYKKVITSDALRDYFDKNIINYILSDEGSNNVNGPFGSINVIPKVALLGDVIYRLLSIPIGLGRFYDEIRVTTYDFNDYAGAMGGLNIGSLPIRVSRLTDSLNMTTNATCMSLIQSFLATASDPAYEPYGVKSALERKNSMESKVGSSDDQANAANPTREDAQAIFERTITAIYASKSKINDSNISYEPKFVPPEIKLETVVMPVSDGVTIKHVLCVFIYDGANSGKSETNIIISAMKKSSGVVKVINSSSDINSESNFFTITKNGKDSTYDVSINKSQASSILSAAYPTLKIGTEGSVITNASYSTTSSGNVENALQFQAVAQTYSGVSGTASSAAVNANLYLTPSSVSITMLGMPLLNRGQNYYIDFGTGTSIDNVYTVTTIKHSIKGGQFTTTATLLPTNAASMTSILTKIRSDMEVVQRLAKNTTSTSETTTRYA